MKIGIITHYDVHNHGALLQLHALKTILAEKGHDVKALTFKKNYDFYDEGLDKKYNISILSFFWYLSYLKNYGLRRTLFNINKKQLLSKFRNPLVGEYYSRAKNLDAVFIGSDEVFSVECGVNPFFYGIAVPCKNIYSYAASFGPTTYEMIKNRNVAGMISGGLHQLKKISVRDENSRNLVSLLSQHDSAEVCDPVILHSFKNEQKNFVRKIKKDYLLIYAYDNNMNSKEEIDAIKKFAEKHNLLIVSAGYYHKWCDKCVDGDPLDILSYFKYAKYVFTDTFHGSVMSLITGSEFVTKIRTNKNKLLDLLNRFSVSDRILEDFNNAEDVVKNKIDYNSVNSLIDEYRNASMQFIDSCLEDALHE